MKEQDSIEARHEELLDFLYMVPVGLARIGNDGAFDLVNPMCARLLLPLSANGLLTNLFDVLEPVAPCVRHAVASFGQSRGTVLSDERIALAPPAGGACAQVLSISLIRLDAAALLVSFHDVSESVRREALMRDKELANRRLEDARDAALAATQLKSGFLANMSHELRTPMHAIASFTRMGLARIADLPREKLRRYLENIDASATRLNNLLNDLLDLSKIEAGKMEYRFEQRDVGTLLRASMGEFEAMAADRGVTLLLDDAFAEEWAEVDEVRIRQVFANLLSNAIKFSPSGATVSTGMALVLDDAGAPRLVVSFADRGPGLPADELELIFEKFMQSSQTRTGAGGTGLGLAIVREIVSAHGGRVSAANRPGGGAEFMVELPVARATAP
jgi:signal transduction histidine kinase